jgi:hypothetical protein
MSHEPPRRIFLRNAIAMTLRARTLALFEWGSSDNILLAVARLTRYGDHISSSVGRGV